MYIKKPVLIIGAVILILVTAILSIGAVNPFGFFEVRDLLHFQYVSQLMMDSYYEDVDASAYMHAALQGMADATNDPYTAYMWGAEAEEYLRKVDGNYQGVGLYIVNNTEDNTIEVVSVIARSPAEKAGIFAGDKILKINGKSYTGLQMSEAAAAMRGMANTQVTITLLKKQDGNTVDTVLTRGEIDIQSVSGTMLEDDIGRINITEFNQGTARDFSEVYQALKDQGMKQMILDLRNNPGGLLNEAVEVLDTFVDEGKVLVSVLDRYENRRDFLADEGAEEVPMVVLTNQNSASASEIVTGCLKDYGIAYHIGEKTYGKGIVQDVFETGGNSLLSVTVARYYTPKGVCIHQAGIRPDLKIVMEPEKYTDLTNLKAEEDAQLQAAIAYLKR